MKVSVVRRLSAMVLATSTWLGLSKSQVIHRLKIDNFFLGPFLFNLTFVGGVVAQDNGSNVQNFYSNISEHASLSQCLDTRRALIKDSDGTPGRSRLLYISNCNISFGFYVGYHQWFTLTGKTSLAPDYKSVSNFSIGYLFPDNTQEVLKGDSECPINGGESLAECESSPENLTKRALAVAVKATSCAPSSWVGNPVMVSNGLKIQKASIPFTSLYMYYNSVDGRWSVDFSHQLMVGKSVVILSLPNGGQIFSYGSNGSYFVESNQVGGLTHSDKWIYSSLTERMVFNAQGVLEEYQAVSGEAYTLTYSSDVVSISSNSGERYEITNASQRPVSIKSKGAEVSFEYDTAGRLTKLVSSQGGETEQRIYHYEDPRDLKLLTGITDERGIRYATWSYDDQGRAISSEHAGGAEKVTLTYKDDGSTTVTNALGKQTTYRFQVIHGVKRITAIEGEPSADCTAATSTYTYNDRGQVLTATDAEGRVTRYAYNNRGLEISRIEGEGTAEARTVTTEWDPERYRRTQVTADGRRTLYSYDDQGRLLSERTEAVSSN